MSALSFVFRSSFDQLDVRRVFQVSQLMRNIAHRPRAGVNIGLPGIDVVVGTVRWNREEEGGQYGGSGH